MRKDIILVIGMLLGEAKVNHEIRPRVSLADRKTDVIYSKEREVFTVYQTVDDKWTSLGEVYMKDYLNLSRASQKAIEDILIALINLPRNPKGE